MIDIILSETFSVSISGHSLCVSGIGDNSIHRHLVAHSEIEGVLFEVISSVGSYLLFQNVAVEIEVEINGLFEQISYGCVLKKTLKFSMSNKQKLKTEH